MKRGESGLSLLLAVNKPKGMSSHDVVNRCRRVYGERRVGHTGTLDPLATGVLPICVGPATRLDQFMVGHDKAYRVTMGFGYETTTDDAEGEAIERCAVPARLYDEDFARACVKALEGVHEQVPPKYSAIKVGGVKAYEAARKGGEVEIPARTVSVYDAVFTGLAENLETVSLAWTFDVRVSKGTYIRSLVRDLGRELSCLAHLVELERFQSGRITLEDCAGLDTLERCPDAAILDPVRVLGFRFAFGDDLEKSVNSGSALPVSALSLYEPLPMENDETVCACSSGICPSGAAPVDGETICVILGNRLKALYRFEASRERWKPACVFSIGIARQ